MRFFNSNISTGSGTRAEQIEKLKSEINSADVIIIGAGAGLSTAAGLTYGGERFYRYFSDFAKEFGIRDMYSGGFYPFPDRETYWAWWSRQIYYNRYIDAPKPVYGQLLSLVEGKDYFVITTNVDHQFQRAGFDKNRLFYTQGDYGLFQCVNPVEKKTYDNEAEVYAMMEAQGFVRNEKGIFDLHASGKVKMKIPTELIPKCPDNGEAVTMNLRCDDTFVEDSGWHRASDNYTKFLSAHDGQHILFLEFGVGANTPVIIKYVFQKLTFENPLAVYACINYGEAYAPMEISDRSIILDGDAGEIITALMSSKDGE